MARVVLACWRDPAQREKDRITEGTVATLLARVSPDNIASPPAKTFGGPGLLVGVLHPGQIRWIEGSSVCLGTLFAPSADWWKPGSELPDGSYALFRSDHGGIELVTDIVASRTIWYFHDENRFFASNSQRALISLIGDFKPDRNAVAWMLSAGMLGPGRSWDERIHPLEADTRAHLDRHSWRLRIDRKEVAFRPSDRTWSEQESSLRDALKWTFDELDLDLAKWPLLLSGGVDSRGILHLLKTRPGLHAVTWGARSSFADPESDGYLAADLAARAGVPHTPFYVSDAETPVATILTRFCSSGEGRVSDIEGYMDGCDTWRQLYEAGALGVIRGDEVMGWLPVFSQRGVKRLHGALRFSDYADPRGLFGEWVDHEPEWPAALARRHGETNSTWRDRLFQEFRIPIVPSGLNELKSAYVEVVNPLLSRRIVETIRTFPDRMRTDKPVFQRIVAAFDAQTRWPKHGSLGDRHEILRREPMRRHLVDELDTAAASSILSDELAERMVALLRTSLAAGQASSGSMRSTIGRLFPAALRGKIRDRVKPSLDPYVLALRAYLAVRSHRMLEEDALFLPAMPPMNRDSN